MSDTFKFPNGYDVTVCRKQDIIDCLDSNVVDKDVVLAIITQCEVDATRFIREGRWTGIPFLGNIRMPKILQELSTPETKELIEHAKNTLDRNRYLVFRNKLHNDICNKEKEDRYFRYIVSHFVNTNKEYYVKLHKKYGENFAQLLCFTLANMTIGEPRENNDYECET